MCESVKHIHGQTLWCSIRSQLCVLKAKKRIFQFTNIRVNFAAEKRCGVVEIDCVCSLGKQKIRC